jgi:hypothetical protein
MKENRYLAEAGILFDCARPKKSLILTKGLTRENGISRARTPCGKCGVQGSTRRGINTVENKTPLRKGG